MTTKDKPHAYDDALHTLVQSNPGRWRESTVVAASIEGDESLTREEWTQLLDSLDAAVRSVKWPTVLSAAVAQ